MSVKNTERVEKRTEVLWWDDMDGDVFETKLIKNAVALFNDILPVALPNVKDGVMHAFELEDLDRGVDTTAYASNVLWSLRRHFEEKEPSGWLETDWAS